MTIMDKVEERIKQIQDSATEGEKNKALAIAAIIGGIKSPAWETYMRQYIDAPTAANPDLPTRQLMRLLGTDDTRDNPQMQERRAYLVANATCAQGTGSGLGGNANTLDDGVS
jgi:hypothetical protein